MNVRARAGLAALAMLAAGVASCSRDRRQGPGVESASLRDELGRTVTPRALPVRRVVSLAPNVTELLFALGAEGLLVGVDRFSDQPAGRVESLARVGSNYEPSLETIVALKPDLVLLSKSANRRETADALERLGVPAFVTVTPALSDLDRTLRDLGQLTGRTARAEAELDRLQRGFAAVRARVHDLPRPRVLVAVWTEPLYAGGRGTFIDDLIEMAGGQNVASEVSGYATFPIERVLRASPEVIILPTHAPEAKATSAVAYWSRWPALRAVRDHRVVPVEDSLISRPGPRLVEGAEQVARILHPELAGK